MTTPAVTESTCTGHPNGGMCIGCAPWMFPTPEREVGYAEWFKAYRAYRKQRAPERIALTTLSAQDIEIMRSVLAR